MRIVIEVFRRTGPAYLGVFVASGRFEGDGASSSHPLGHLFGGSVLA